jgi:hypothetical protein
MNINKITPKDEKVSWTEVKIIIKGADGSIKVTADVLTADPGAGGYVSPGAIEYWYVEATADTKMSAGDGIKVTGMDASYEGATIEFASVP